MWTSDQEIAIREAARIASHFSLKPDRSIHPDITWDQMSEQAKLITHTTAQQIAGEILELLEKEEI